MHELRMFWNSRQQIQVDLCLQPLIIGSGPDVDLPVQVSGVSRLHCIIYTTRLSDSDILAGQCDINPIYLLRDLNSTNGTFINGKCLSSDEQLTSGDVIQFGCATAVFL